jgi:alkyldihydroxyacetonephosphate synthase
MSEAPPPPAPPERRRSLWAWGWADKLPDAAARRGLAQVAHALLGPRSGSDAVVEAPGPDDDAAPLVPAARVGVPPALADLASADPHDRAAHTHGRGYLDLVRGCAGDYACAPDLVARPGDAAAVARVLEVADAHGLVVVPFGGGTSVVGGVTVPAEQRDRPVLTLDLARLGALREVDPVSRVAWIEAGATGPALEAALAAHGLTLRHFPQSFEFSTLGGWLATRAGGHYATGPTHIDDLCQALTMITPRGPLTTARRPASGAGPEPLRLALGSEGALGVITDAWMRVVPRPRWRGQATAAFTRFEDGVAAARALAQSGLLPSNARLLDGAEARLHRVGFDGASLLLIGFESADHPPDAALARACELARDHGGALRSGPTVRDDAAAQPGQRDAAAGAWRQAFLDAPYLQSALITVGVLVDTFETACTWAAFPALHADVTAAVRAALVDQCGGGVVTCRFTHVYPDGPAPYYTSLGWARPGAEAAQWAAIKRAASDALTGAGGTITHHHAVGRVHAPWYRRERPPLFADALAAVKRSLDPRGLMNPGVLVD